MPRIGLDVTSVDGWRRRMNRTPEMAALVFTPAERTWAATDPENAAQMWAIKEAVVKALGTGFVGIGWHGVEIDPGATALTLSCNSLPDWATASAARWWIGTAVVDGWAAALATCSTGPLQVALRMHRLRIPVTARAARSRVQSAAARRVARDALTALLPGGRNPGELTWGVADGGAPVVHTADGTQIPVSLSHCSGVVAAVVALPTHVLYLQHDG